MGWGDSWSPGGTEVWRWRVGGLRVRWRSALWSLRVCHCCIFTQQNVNVRWEDAHTVSAISLQQVQAPYILLFVGLTKI